MKRTIINYFDKTVSLFPEKIFVEEDKQNVSYKEFHNRTEKIATVLLEKDFRKCGIAIYLDKEIKCLEAMFGVMYSSCFYCILDTKSPLERITIIKNTLEPCCYITDSKHLDKIKELDIPEGQIINIDCIDEIEVNRANLDFIKKRILDSDPAYVLFTSGSTGIPKGTVVSHASIIAYVDAIIDTFSIDSSVIFGNQTPFYFSMSVLDIFTTAIVGGTIVLIPKMLFSFPVKLTEFMNDKKVNTIYWVPTALGIVANRNTFKSILPKYLTKIMFAGEVMPVKQLNYWINYLEDCMFANLYGPTEITDTGTYYIVDRKFEDSDILPIGIPFDNCDVLLLNEQNQEAQKGEEGEICIRGSFLAYGYYNNPEKTGMAFCQNPINTAYPEKIYRTGDIGKYNDRGELLYICRKDFQIKRMGYRIELGEIESVGSGSEKINNCACVYNQEKEKIYFCYAGSIEEDDIRKYIKGRLPIYMQPDYFIKMQVLPINANGKIDRLKLLEDCKDLGNI